MSFAVWTWVGTRNHVLYRDAHWRHLANTTEPSVCALCQILWHLSLLLLINKSMYGSFGIRLRYQLARVQLYKSKWSTDKSQSWYDINNSVLEQCVWNERSAEVWATNRSNNRRSGDSQVGLELGLGLASIAQTSVACPNGLSPKRLATCSKQWFRGTVSVVYCDLATLTDDWVTARQVVECPTNVRLKRLTVAATETARSRHSAGAARHRAQWKRVLTQSTRREVSTALVLLLLLLLLALWNLVHGRDHIQSRFQRTTTTFIITIIMS